MTIEYEPTPRKTGLYIANIPGLTPQRLGELYAGILHATQDPSAKAEVTYFASGGMRIEIDWHQKGMGQHYPALLTAEEVAGVLDVDEDTLFTEFAQRTLDAVREIRNQLAEAAPNDADQDIEWLFNAGQWEKTGKLLPFKEWVELLGSINGPSTTAAHEWTDALGQHHWIWTIKRAPIGTPEANLEDGTLGYENAAVAVAVKPIASAMDTLIGTIRAGLTQNSPPAGQPAQPEEP